jgi:hypothetical protein
MSPPPSDEAGNLLPAVLDHALEDRETFLAKACEGKAELLAEVRTLLAAHEAAPTGLLATPATDAVTGVDLDVTIKMPDR